MLLEQEKRSIVKALLANNGNKTQAAKQLGINLRTLYRRLARYGITKEMYDGNSSIKRED